MLCINIKLNLGCGKKHLKGYINIDIEKDVKPDMILDLNKYPYPFGDNSIDKIYMEHSLEHIDDIIKCLKEIYRILKPNGTFHLIIPHFSYGLSHLFHKHHFSYGFLTQIRHIKGIHFEEIRKMRFNWTRQPIFLMKLLNYPLNFLANLHQGACERLWCYWVGGFEEMDFMMVKK